MKGGCYQLINIQLSTKIWRTECDTVRKPESFITECTYKRQKKNLQIARILSSTCFTWKYTYRQHKKLWLIDYALMCSYLLKMATKSMGKGFYNYDTCTTCTLMVFC